MVKFARILEMSCPPFGALSQCFRVQEKRNPTPLMIQLVGSLSGAVPPDGGGGHLSALKRHEDGGKEPVKWAEDGGVLTEPPEKHAYADILRICLDSNNLSAERL